MVFELCNLIDVTYLEDYLSLLFELICIKLTYMTKYKINLQINSVSVTLLNHIIMKLLLLCFGLCTAFKHFCIRRSLSLWFKFQHSRSIYETVYFKPTTRISKGLLWTAHPHSLICRQRIYVIVTFLCVP